MVGCSHSEHLYSVSLYVVSFKYSCQVKIGIILLSNSVVECLLIVQKVPRPIWVRYSCFIYCICITYYLLPMQGCICLVFIWSINAFTVLQCST